MPIVGCSQALCAIAELPCLLVMPSNDICCQSVILQWVVTQEPAPSAKIQDELGALPLNAQL